MLRRASLDDSPSTAGPGAPFVGEIAAMPPATALTILENSIDGPGPSKCA